VALVAAYSFDTDYSDASGGGNTITSTGNSAIVSGGQTGSALGKTGATMPVLPAGVLLACQSDDRTIMFDAKGNLTTWWVRFEKDAIGSGTWGVLNISGSMAVQARRASDDSLATRPTATAPDASGWHNYCATYVRSTGVISLYRDGTLASTQSFAAGTQLTVNADRINIAEWSATGAAVDNLRLYSHALDATAVAATAGTPVTSGAITGSGAVTAPKAVAAGTGTAPVAGSGAPTAPAAVAAGTGTVVVSGSGAATTPKASVAGAGMVVVAGSGALTASPAVAAGSGAVAVSGSGALTAPSASAAGAGGVDVTASGALVAPPAVVSGTGGGVAPIEATSALIAPAARAAGAGQVVVTGVGACVAPAAVVHGYDRVIRAAVDPVVTIGRNLSALAVASSPAPLVVAARQATLTITEEA